MLRFRYIVPLCLFCMLLSACEKNTMSKIPQISLTEFYPEVAMKVNVDSVLIVFHLEDGDADLGPEYKDDTMSSIHIKDSRFDSLGFTVYTFPYIDKNIEDPNKGLVGECVFFPVPQPIPRDSLHGITGDTMYYEFYITDRARHESNHIKTHTFIIKP